MLPGRGGGVGVQVNGRDSDVTEHTHVYVIQ